MFNNVRVKILLTISLLSLSGVTFSCAAHKEKAEQQTNNTLAATENPAIANNLENTSKNTAPSAPEVKVETSATNTPSNPTTQIASEPNAKIKVLEFVLTNQIVGREPKDIVEKYSPENRTAYAFARLNTKENAQVTFLWFQGDKEHRRFTTHVEPASQWRTNASIKVNPGQWKVQLLSDGQVLAERTFTVQ